MIGTTIGRYRIISKLGQGGMGTVWLAEDPVLGRTVAVKVLPEGSVHSPESRERLLREARTACQLHHPGIATVYEAGEEDGRIYLAFEHVDGETVAERVKREGPLPVEEALRIAREAAAALGHAHGQGVLHRDVTSRNFMLDASGRAKLVDFGLARPEGETRVTRPASTSGTIAYVAPEVVQGKRGDRRADLYGLGVVLYEMLTGTLPFERDRAEAVLYAVVNEEPVPPQRHRPDLPAELEAVVLRALAKDPERRFADASELTRALERGSNVRGDSVPSPRRRHALLVAVPALALAALAYWLLRPEAGFESVAVLPLELSGPNAQESAYLATGLADALATRLGRVSHLRVTPWVTSRRYPPVGLPLPDIASDLNVESLVVGSFREEEGKLRIELSLVGAGGAVAWSKEFEDTKIGLLELQEEIILAVARSVRRELTPAEEEALSRRPTDRAEAYDQYLHGVAALQGGGWEATEQALAHFETALAMDPRLAEARIGVGAAHMARYDNGWAGRESLSIAEESFRRALEIGPDELPALRGLIRVYWTDRNEESLRIAREIRDSREVSVEALLAQGEGMLLGGLPEQAIPLFQTVRQLDPQNEAAEFFVVVAYGEAGDFQNAIRAGEEYLRSFGDDAEIHFWIAGSYSCLANREAALAHCERALALCGEAAPSYMCSGAAVMIRELAGKERARTLAREGIRQLESRVPDAWRSPMIACDLAHLYVIAGDTTKALECGRQLRENNGAWYSNPDAYHLVQAYAEIGDEETATELLREIAEHLRASMEVQGSAGKSGGETGGMYFSPKFLRQCQFDRAGGPWLLQHLPAFDDVAEALRAEQARRRAVYGS